MYGRRRPPQSETTPFYPRSPYAAAKVYAYWITVNYREAYGMYACNGILFNHESPRRGETFVTRKITRAAGAHRSRAAGRALPRQPRRRRDWGYAARLRRGDVADAAAGRSPTTTSSPPASRTRCASSCERRSRELGTRARVARRRGRRAGCRTPRAARRLSSRPALLPAHRGRPLLGDAAKAQRELGWRPRSLRRAGERDGRRDLDARPSATRLVRGCAHGATGRVRPPSCDGKRDLRRRPPRPGRRGAGAPRSQARATARS